MSQVRHASQDRAGDLVRILLKRKQVVDCLREGTTSKRDMVDTLDISRPTVDRSIRDLEEHGVVERRDGDYKFTLYGLFVVNKFRNMLNTYETFIKVRPLLLSLPSETHLTMSVLEGAEVTVPEEYAPHEPLKYCEREIERADEVKMILPTILPRQIEFFAEQAVESELACELIVREEAVDVLLSSYGEYLGELLNEDGSCTVRSTTDPTQYGVLLVDSEVVHIIGYSKEGGITAVITNDSNAAVEWAEGVFVQCRQGSNEVTFRGDGSETDVDDHLFSFVLEG